MTGDAAVGAEGRRTFRSRIRSLTSGAPLLPLVLLFGLNAVDELDRTAFEVLLPNIRDDFGLGNTGILAVVALVVPAQLLVAVPVARRADKRRRVPIALVGASAWGVFSLLTGFSYALAMLIVCRLGAGLGRAVNDPVHASL